MQVDTGRKLDLFKRSATAVSQRLDRTSSKQISSVLSNVDSTLGKPNRSLLEKDSRKMDRAETSSGKRKVRKTLKNLMRSIDMFSYMEVHILLEYAVCSSIVNGIGKIDDRRPRKKETETIVVVSFPWSCCRAIIMLSAPEI